MNREATWSPTGALIKSQFVAFLRFLWHKTAVLVFIERFILPLFAGIVILVAVSNPMGFDRTQRITGSMALVFAAYFFAHTIYKKPAEPERLFAGDVLTAVLGPREIWATTNQLVSPVDAVLLLRVVNTQEKPASISSISVELKTGDNRWVRFRHIPTVPDVVLYAGPLNNARRITITPEDSVDVLTSKGALSPGDPALGTMCLLSVDQVGFPTFGSSTFRITLEDTEHRLTAFETSPVYRVVDIFGNVGGLLKIHFAEDTADLSKLEVRRLFLRP